MGVFNEINSVTDLVMGASEQSGEKMTYNEWRQIRKRRKMLYKAPVCKTRLESMTVQPGYNIRLSVVIIGFPAPSVTWLLDNEEIEEDEKFCLDHDESASMYTLTISQISGHEAGCYQCLAENAEGADSTFAFIKVKEPSRHRRKRSVSQRPHISTIREWKSKEEEEKVDRDPQEERLLLRNRQCWDWWNLNAASDDEKRAERDDKSNESIDMIGRNGDSKTEHEWEATKKSKSSKTLLTRSRSRSLPPDARRPAPVAKENNLKRLKSFWESKRHR